MDHAAYALLSTFISSFKQEGTGRRDTTSLGGVPGRVQKEGGGVVQFQVDVWSSERGECQLHTG